LDPSYALAGSSRICLAHLEHVGYLQGLMMSIEDGFNGLSADDLVKMTAQSDKGYTITATKMPVGDIKVYEGTRYFKFVPKEDMTGQEAGWMAMLFTTAVISSRGIGITDYDYMGFVRAHGLERHFEEEL
jgi:hypothetical protein